MKFAKTLNRDEMKNVMAGIMAGGCSDLYCRIGGSQTWMGSDCFGDTLGGATARCISAEENFGHTCGGCASM